jgi:ATP phosphoribosyltransferase
MKEQPNFHAAVNGLIPVVIQSHDSLEVLMVGYMNEDAWNLTISSGKVHYYSRKKQRIWLKGEQSGNYQNVKEILLNCDNTSLLILVEQIGGACDQGLKSCFDKVFSGGEFVSTGSMAFDPKDAYGKNFTDEIILGIPSGSLEQMTFELLNLANYDIERDGNRCYHPIIKNEPTIHLIMARAQELPLFLDQGMVDVIVTGLDLVSDSEIAFRDLADLRYNKLGIGPVSIAVAVSEDAIIQHIEDFTAKRIATAYPNITKRFFDSLGINITPVPSLGATEGKVPYLADAIVDLVETGFTLRSNSLKPIIKIFDTTVHLFTNNSIWGYTWKRRKIEQIAQKLQEASKKLPRNPKNCPTLPTYETWKVPNGERS